MGWFFSILLIILGALAVYPAVVAGLANEPGSSSTRSCPIKGSSASSAWSGA